MMKLKSLLLAAICLTGEPSGAVYAGNLTGEPSGTVPAVVWYDGRQAVSYQVQGKVAPVVEIALQMFSSDMEQVTGRSAVSAKDATILIYELDKNTPAASRLSRQGVPVSEVQGRHDAFWMGIRDGRILVVGEIGRASCRERV